MKKQSTFSAARLLTVLCTLYVSVLAGTGSAGAAEIPQDTSSKAPQFNYVGYKEDLLSSSVHYANPDGEKFVLEVKDENSDVLYQHVFENRNFTKKIYLINTRDKALVTFGIRAGKQVYKETFQVNPNITIVEELIVKRL